MMPILMHILEVGRLMLERALIKTGMLSHSNLSILRKLYVHIGVFMVIDALILSYTGSDLPGASNHISGRPPTEQATVNQKHG